MNSNFLKEHLPLVITIIIVFILFFYIQNKIATINTEVTNLNKLINISNSLPEQHIESITPYNETQIHIPDDFEQLVNHVSENQQFNFEPMESFFSANSNKESFIEEIQDESQEEIQDESQEEIQDESQDELQEEIQDELQENETTPLIQESLEQGEKECIAIIKSGKKKGKQCAKGTKNNNGLCKVHDK